MEKATKEVFRNFFNCYRENFMVAPCVIGIKHFSVQLMHTNYKKILRLLKWLKL